MLTTRILIALIIVSLFTTGYMGYLYYSDVFKPKSTLAIEGCQPIDIEFSKTKDSITIRWNTIDECVSYIKIGEDKNNITRIVADANGLDKATVHEAIVNDLHFGDDYYLIVYSGGKAYGDSGLPMLVKMDEWK